MADAPPVLDQATVRALCEAGFLPTRDYLAIAAEQGWARDAFQAQRERRAAPFIPPRDGGGFDTYLSAEIDT